ncbi:hypothetical protein LTS16_001388 [Friedmanniomyces endolithicus]|uniref:Uncharacterized protein n=1 Tax=Friedmanniomyces endolithicus TaxID=329885 RepID=A0AAN6FFK4_9PEZI|nr:hypothetical protein LTR82_012760 [Friedmanniomyces endolithicus]KAK0928155.1 hypothetical protein LTR57_002889 [Friedmanniomyces endolithicus]KAK1003210.1 hypothetical protein LTS01_004081 [Friedmanniomyces endolithicus]KAK1052965.1 hypothetical protein LTS16_001388 [Friedmanniomyces endolithicus]
MSIPGYALESDDPSKQLCTYNPHQPWPMPPHRLQRVRPESVGLLTLPKELRDAIFDLVYRDLEPRHYYINHRSWDGRERARRRAGGLAYVSPPSHHLVNKLMVSKAFFVDAALPCVKYLTLASNSTGTSDPLPDDGIVSAYATTATLRGDSMSRCVSQPKLTQLTSLAIRLTSQSLGEGGNDHYVWWRLLTLHEIRHLCVYQSIMLLEHLRRVEVLDDEWAWSRHAEWPPFEIEMWCGTLRLFENTINQDLLERKEVRQSKYQLWEGERATLYPESKVRLTSPPPAPLTTRSLAPASTLTIGIESDAHHLLITTQSSEASPNAPPQRSRLLTLPQDIRDTIFTLAFPHKEDVKNISHREWMYRDMIGWHSYDRTSAIMPSFDHKVNDFMVSKAFFVEAARAFVSNSTGFSPYTAKDSLGAAWSCRSKIFAEYTTAVTTDSLDLDLCRNLTHLTSVRILVGLYDFEDVDFDDMWQYPVTAEEARDLQLYASAMSCQGLTEIQIGDNEREAVLSDAKQAVWAQRLEALQNTLDQGLKEKMLTTHQTGYAGNLMPRRGDGGDDIDTTLPDSGIPDSVPDLDLSILREPHAMLN